jgi:hypothetical protein
MIKRIKAEFTRTLHLPRFTVKKGEVWEVRVDRLERFGFKLAGGFVSNDEYKVINDGFKIKQKIMV